MTDHHSPTIIQPILAETAIGSGPARSHVLLRFDEQSVRAEIAQVIETDETVTALTADAVTDADIHAACCAVVEQTNRPVGRARCGGVSGSPGCHPRGGAPARCFRLMPRHSIQSESPAIAPGSFRFGVPR
jgi:hypothetical protein